MDIKYAVNVLQSESACVDVTMEVQVLTHSNVFFSKGLCSIAIARVDC
jgi:hypothetical protein